MVQTAMQIMAALTSYLLLIYWTAFIILQIAIAFGIFSDAGDRLDRELPLRFLWPSGWALVGLLFGPLGAIVYWLMHYSSFDAAALRQNLDQAGAQLAVTSLSYDNAVPAPATILAAMGLGATGLIRRRRNGI